jgi:hypothetical protein
MALDFKKVLVFAAVALSAGVFSFPSMARSPLLKQGFEIGRPCQLVYGSQYGWPEIQALRAFTRMP